MTRLSDSELVDRIELLVAFSEEDRFSFVGLSSMCGALWEAEELAISYALSEMRGRSATLGEKYPFDVGKQYVAYKGVVNSYLMLLVMSCAPWLETNTHERKMGDVAKPFEHVVEEAVSTFFGDRTQTVNFGWPSETGRPQEFPRAIGWLAEKIGIRTGVGYRQPRRRDGGVDIVTWRSFGDGKPGVPILLVQVTVQTDFIAKSRDIDRRMWASWLAMDMEPLVALAVPHIIPDIEEWNEVAVNSLLLDRLRLAAMLPSVSSSLQNYGSLVEATREAIETVVDN